jgi:hypothetical protein
MAKSALPTPEDARDRKLLADIARVGWAVLGIPADDEGPGYAFSIGLYHTFAHPEVILFGLPWEASYPFINAIGAAVREGQRFEAGRRYDDLAEGYPSAFEPVPRRHFKEYLGTAGWFYQGWDFRVLQLVWPDRAGVFPWEAGADPRYRRVQPVLSGRAERGPVADQDRDGS